MPELPMSHRSGRYFSPSTSSARKPVASAQSSVHIVTALEISHREYDMEDLHLTGMTRCLSNRLRALNFGRSSETHQASSRVA